ncbi:MAG: hypothetical protein AB8B49_02930 [Nitratireductor sp.]
MSVFYPLFIEFYLVVCGFVVAGFLHALHLCKLDYQQFQEIDQLKNVQISVSHNNEIEFENSLKNAQNASRSTNMFQTLKFNSMSEIMWSVCMSFFAGSFALLKIANPLKSDNNLKAYKAIALLGVAIVWSYCAGLVIRQTALLLLA